jgi:hypothetical protein
VDALFLSNYKTIRSHQEIAEGSLSQTECPNRYRGVKKEISSLAATGRKIARKPGESKRGRLSSAAIDSRSRPVICRARDSQRDRAKNGRLLAREYYEIALIRISAV